ncbi:hypothetical protein F441_22573 [Phytophthora nicotianae CJ01A1]|uniref:Uncharacterized protein n=1 Tax=Phytophthora nicotianae CJ01A1 TaxID=1317063 RepID=W2VNR7_PHYNI|nr:hypothetical protein F441_22573 [Phytophthora nicotianae CJ01A1]
MVDTSFEIDELEYWAEKYLVIENKPNRDFDLNFSTFEKMLKTTNFESLHLLNDLCSTSSTSSTSSKDPISPTTSES